MQKAITTILLVCVLLPLQVFSASLDDITIYTENTVSYNYLDDENKLKGVAVDLLESAYTKAGFVLDRSQIKVEPWPHAYKALLRDKNVMLFSTVRSPEREKLFKWAGPIAPAKIALIAKKSRNIVISKTEDLHQYFIGGISKDIGLELVHKLIGNDENLFSTPYVNSLAGMLNLERIDLWAYGEKSAFEFIKRNNLNVDDFETVYLLDESEYYYAFSLNTDQTIVDQLQMALDSLQKLEPKK